jgi:hypothetical protein
LIKVPPQPLLAIHHLLSWGKENSTLIQTEIEQHDPLKKTFELLSEAEQTKHM